MSERVKWWLTFFGVLATMLGPAVLLFCFPVVMIGALILGFLISCVGVAASLTNDFRKP